MNTLDRTTHYTGVSSKKGLVTNTLPHRDATGDGMLAGRLPVPDNGTTYRSTPPRACAPHISFGADTQPATSVRNGEIVGAPQPFKHVYALLSASIDRSDCFSVCVRVRLSGLMCVCGSNTHSKQRGGGWLMWPLRSFSFTPCASTNADFNWDFCLLYFYNTNIIIWYATKKRYVI